MNKIIIISGKQYSGKDTLANILLQLIPCFKRVGIGDAIKIEYAKKNNLTLDEIIKNKHLYRNDLIELGNYGRSINPDYWLNNLANMDKIIVPDVRMKHELEYFKSKNAFLVRIESDLSKRLERGIVVSQNDNTETELDSYTDWNFIVENNSDIQALSEQADILLKKFVNFLSLP